MPDEERWLVAKVLLLKIHAITGWTLPVSEMMNIFIDQMQKKMQESYRNVTAEEVEYAFRNRGLDIKDWGKELNLTMVDEVMFPHLNTRSELSKFEEQQKNKPPEIEEKKQLSDEEWKEWLEDISKYEVNKIPCASYEYLVRKEKIILSPKEKHDYMERAIGHIAATMDVASLEGIEFFKMKTKGEYSASVTGTLITIAKRLVVFDYFHK